LFSVNCIEKEAGNGPFFKQEIEIEMKERYIGIRGERERKRKIEEH